MKTISNLIRAAAAYILIVSLFMAANAQTAGGGVAGDTNKVIAAAGLSASAARVDNNAKSRIRNLFTKEAIARKWKRPAKTTTAKKPVTKTVSKTVTVRNPKTGKVTRTVKKTTVPVAPEPDDTEEEYEAPKYYAAFMPDYSVDNMRTLADAIGTNKQQRDSYYSGFTEIKNLYESNKLVNINGKNNVAGALTFFVLANSLIYHGDLEKGTDDETDLALYDAINANFDKTPGMEKISDREKQALYDVYISLAAIPLSVYLLGQQENNPQMKQIARALAGEFLKQMLSINPDEVRFPTKK